MKTQITLGSGTVCIAAGLFETVETKQQFIGIRFQLLNKQLEIGEVVTDPRLVDNRYETMIRLDNMDAIYSMEKAVKRARYEMEKLNAKKSETIHQATEQTTPPAEPNQD